MMPKSRGRQHVGRLRRLLADKIDMRQELVNLATVRE